MMRWNDTPRKPEPLRGDAGFSAAAVRSGRASDDESADSYLRSGAVVMGWRLPGNGLAGPHVAESRRTGHAVTEH
jgi:hypothetical protein